jgi:hypothetical protein
MRRPKITLDLTIKELTLLILAMQKVPVNSANNALFDRLLRLNDAYEAEGMAR